ncbi:hypothetical protein C5167_027405 [Papaver somniferum]|nr:hypothetical protein C5167_027405 [Papaver somniferum]
MIRTLPQSRRVITGVHRRLAIRDCESGQWIGWFKKELYPGGDSPTVVASQRSGRRYCL